MSDASGLIVIYPNIHDVEITIYNASGGVISAPSQNTFYMESLYNNRTCAVYSYNGNDTAASFTVVKDGYKIYTSDYPASHSGYLPGNIELEPWDNISKLSNGTDTYVLKDETARTSISTIQNNLVTSVSSASTDSQYPSAKCVYDLFGTIESQLAEVNSKITMATFTVTISKASQYIDSFIIEGVDYKSSFIDNTSNGTCSANIQLPKGSSYEWTLNYNTYVTAYSSTSGKYNSAAGILIDSVDLTSGDNFAAISLTMAAA